MGVDSRSRHLCAPSPVVLGIMPSRGPPGARLGAPSSLLPTNALGSVIGAATTDQTACQISTRRVTRSLSEPCEKELALLKFARRRPPICKKCKMASAVQGNGQMNFT